MTRVELLKFAVEVSRDEYVRGQGRLALIETKAQLIALTAGAFATVLVTYGIDKLPLNSPGSGLMAALTMGSLLVALVYSLSASLLLEVSPPPSADSTNSSVAELLGNLGKQPRPRCQESGAAVE